MFLQANMRSVQFRLRKLNWKQLWLLSDKWGRKISWWTVCRGPKPTEKYQQKGKDGYTEAQSAPARRTKSHGKIHGCVTLCNSEC